MRGTATTRGTKVGRQVPHEVGRSSPGGGGPPTDRQPFHPISTSSQRSAFIDKAGIAWSSTPGPPAPRPSSQGPMDTSTYSHRQV